MQNRCTFHNSSELQAIKYSGSQDEKYQTEKYMKKYSVMDQGDSGVYSSFESNASSYSSFRINVSQSPRHKQHSKEWAHRSFQCPSSFAQSFDVSHASSTSPALSLTSSYISNCSDQALGKSKSPKCKELATNRPFQRPTLVRHPSIPDNEDDVEEVFSEVGDFTYSEVDHCSLVSGFGNLESPNLDSPKFHFNTSDPLEITSNLIDEPLYMEVEPIYIDMQKTNSSSSQYIHKPLPVELSSRATKRYLQIYGHLRLPETRHSQISVDERTPGCCPVMDSKRRDGVIKDQVVSSYVKNFFSWMSSKAGKGTSIIVGALPTRSKEDFHLVMIGLDGAGKTTVLYRMKVDQYLTTVPTIGFNCERVKGTIGRSTGLTFLVWDVGGQEKIRPLWRSYTRSTDGIIFVLDSRDYTTLDEARMELHRTLNYQDNINIPLLILANKQDLPTALREEDVIRALALRKLRTSLWCVELTCGITGEGLETGIEMMHMMIMKRKMRGKRHRNKTT
jgi:ADP-ribosylation factor-like protein 4